MNVEGGLTEKRKGSSGWEKGTGIDYRDEYDKNALYTSLKMP